MRKLQTLLLGGLFAVPAVSTGAQFAYATTYNQQLMRIDLQSSTTIPIGPLGFTAQGLAETSAGRLYATDPNGDLFDVTGGVVTPVAALGALDVGSMDSGGSTLWGYDNNSQRLFEYDPTTTSFVQWSPTIGLPNVKALAIDPSGDFLVVSAQGAQDKFGKITNGTWGVTLINPNLGLFDHCEAMDFLPDGNLYAAVLQDWRYQLDPTTGNVISGFNTGVHRDWADMAGSPVPEPASIACLVASLASLLRRRKR